MKRSEAAKLLLDLIANVPNIDMMACPFDFEKEILAKLEEAGMQPPAVKEPCETFVLHNGQYIKTEDSFMFTHKWDNE